MLLSFSLYTTYHIDVNTPYCRYHVLVQILSYQAFQLDFMPFSSIAFPALMFTVLECPSISHGGNRLLVTEYQLAPLLYSREKRGINSLRFINCFPEKKGKR